MKRAIGKISHSGKMAKQISAKHFLRGYFHHLIIGPIKYIYLYAVSIQISFKHLQIKHLEFTKVKKFKKVHWFVNNYIVITDFHFDSCLFYFN